MVQLNRDDLKKRIDKLIENNSIDEAREVLLNHFVNLKSNGISMTNFINESNFFLDTVLKIVNN
jgi:hypothetical protein